MSKMKNMVILKNVNSNLVEQAIIIFKENVKIPEENLINKNYSNKDKSSLKDGLCVKEAENIINEYFKEMEKNSKEEKNKNKIKFFRCLNIIFILIILLLAIV